MAKRKKPKQKRNTTPPPTPPPKPTPEKWKWDWKYWLASVLALLGLILGAIGLRARPTVSLEAPLAPGDVLSTPVVISNDGMLDLENVGVESFFMKVAYGNGNFGMGLIGRGYVPPNETLEIGERETVPFIKFVNTNSRIIQADVALIVTFSPNYMPFIRKTRVFRFTTIYQADGRLRLQQQPAGNALEEYKRVEEEVERAMQGKE